MPDRRGVSHVPGQEGRGTNYEELQLAAGEHAPQVDHHIRYGTGAQAGEHQGRTRRASRWHERGSPGRDSCPGTGHGHQHERR